MNAHFACQRARVQPACSRSLVAICRAIENPDQLSKEKSESSLRHADRSPDVQRLQGSTERWQSSSPDARPQEFRRGVTEAAAGDSKATDEEIAWACLAACTAAFTIIAADVNLPTALHLLQPLDSAAHAVVSANMPLEARMIADKPLSNTGLTCATFVSATLMALTALRAPKKGLALASVVVSFNVLVGGILFSKDAVLTKMLKEYFHRVRPTDDLHHTYSFPSGHSTSAYFVFAALFFIILPAWQQARASAGSSAETGILAQITRPRTALLLTVAGGAATQSARVLADVHWVSDTLAGACLGSGGAALAYLLLSRMGVLGQRGARG